MAFSFLGASDAFKKSLFHLHRQHGFWGLSLGGQTVQETLDRYSKTENAVLIQIYTALTAYLLLAYQKFVSKIGLSPQQTFQFITLNLLGTSSPEELLNPRALNTDNSRYSAC